MPGSPATRTTRPRPAPPARTAAPTAASCASRPTSSCSPGEGGTAAAAVAARPSRLVAEGRPGRGRCRPVERGRLAQDVGLELAQPRAPVDPELLAQGVARGLEGAQCLGLPAGSVQGQHQQPVQPLPERVETDQLRQLGRGRGMPADGELGGQPVLESGRRCSSSRCRSAWAKASSATSARAGPPQPERLPQHLGRRPRLAVLQQPVALLGQRHEPGGVEVPGRDHQPVARGLGDQHPRRRPGRATGFQRPAQVRHIGLQRGAGLGGLLLAPQLLDQPVERHHLVRGTSNTASRARCLGRPSSTRRWPSTTSRGPRTRNCTALRRLPTLRAAAPPRERVGGSAPSSTRAAEAKGKHHSAGDVATANHTSQVTYQEHAQGAGASGTRP